jgi:hypothetical protein
MGATMGVRLELTPHLVRLMSPDDQARFTGGPQTESCIRDSINTSRKITTDERKEQGDFANWLLLQNSQGRRIPFSWHATNARSKATPGTPDFFVGIAGHALWFEFKRDASCRLSREQEEFRLCCEAQRIEWHLVHSASEAIEVVQKGRCPAKEAGEHRKGNLVACRLA